MNFLKLVITLVLITLINAQDKKIKAEVMVTAPETAAIYLDGIYTGKKTPASIIVSGGEHKISVGLEEERIYLRKDVTITEEKVSVEFTEDDKVTPATWKALFVGVPKTFGKNRDGVVKETSYTKDELDDAYEFFKFNMRDHIEKFSYGTIKWDIERRDLTKPVELTHTKNDWFTIEAEQGLAELDNVQPGEYDAVFFFWNEEDGSASFKSWYFGLAWLEPTSDEARQTGYVTVKFNQGDMTVAEKLDEYKAKDPGVWTHEWLHLVIEKFYPNLGVKLPIPKKDQLILHAAGVYGYQYPWISWYHDLISGQVPFGETFVGIGPESFLNHSIRKTALAKKAKKESEQKSE